MKPEEELAQKLLKELERVEQLQAKRSLWFWYVVGWVILCFAVLYILIASHELF